MCQLSFAGGIKGIQDQSSPVFLRLKVTMAEAGGELFNLLSKPVNPFPSRALRHSSPHSDRQARRTALRSTY